MLGTARRNGMREHAPLALGLLSLALTLSASSANLLSCDNSFHGGAPPAQLAQSGLECHELADGRSFATFHNGGCENAMYTAFRLSQNDGWGRGAAPEGDESGTEDGGEESTMFVPALYKRGRNAALPASASPLQKMDALTAEVVESRVVPLCSEAGGDVYMQTGVGRLNECQAGVLWSALCCDVPDGSGSFSVGMVQEGGEVVRTVSVEELEELVGVQELFSAGCRGGGGQAEEEMMAFLTERVASSQAHSQESHASEVHEEGEEQPANGGGEEAETPSLAPALGDEPEPEVGSESEDKGNVLLYILSSVVSFLCTPFHVVASTLTKLLSQLAYVLWEDVAVLAKVPGDSLTLGQNLLSGVASGTEGTCDIMYRLAKMGVGLAYASMSMLGSTLLLCCQEGVLGTGMLACDVLGLVTGTLEQGWDLGVFVAGWAGQQLAEYLATVGCEMMQQTWTVGEGLGTLIWRSQRGVGHLLCMLGSIMGGVVENTVENVQEALTGQ